MQSCLPLSERHAEVLRHVPCMRRAGEPRPSMDTSQGGLHLGSTGSGFDEEDAGREGGSGAALPAPVLTPEGARQLSALMDGIVHEFMGMVGCFTLPIPCSGVA